MEGQRSVIWKRTSNPDGSVKGTGRKRGQPLIKASIKPETATQQRGSVSSTTAISLIRQIAGMTEIAQNHSLQARDQLLNVVRSHEKMVSDKDNEISYLRSRIEQLETQKSTTPRLQGGIYRANETGRTITTEIEELRHELGENFNNVSLPQQEEKLPTEIINEECDRKLDSSFQALQTGFTSNSEEETDTDDSSHNQHVERNKTSVQSHITKTGDVDLAFHEVATQSKYQLHSDRPLNIIYATGNITRSA